jgi:hypothetical protein
MYMHYNAYTRRVKPFPMRFSDKAVAAFAAVLLLG